MYLVYIQDAIDPPRRPEKILINRATRRSFSVRRSMLDRLNGEWRGLGYYGRREIKFVSIFVVAKYYIRERDLAPSGLYIYI